MNGCGRGWPGTISEFRNSSSLFRGYLSEKLWEWNEASRKAIVWDSLLARHHLVFSLKKGGGGFSDPVFDSAYDLDLIIG